jgi:hypothetical protein
VDGSPASGSRTWARIAFRYGRQERGRDRPVMGCVTMYGGDLLATEVSVVAGKGKLV